MGFRLVGSRAVAGGNPRVYGGSADSLKTIDNPQGGKIVYGLVDGASSQAAAMGKVLRFFNVVHAGGGSGDAVMFQHRPQGHSFTCVSGNKPVAGLVIASLSGPNRVEAALVSGDAARFGSTVNLIRPLGAAERGRTWSTIRASAVVEHPPHLGAASASGQSLNRAPRNTHLLARQTASK